MKKRISNLACALLFFSCLSPSLSGQTSIDSLAIAAYWSELSFDSAEYQQMLGRIRESRLDLKAIHAQSLPNHVSPSFTEPPLAIPSNAEALHQYPILWELPATQLPESESEIAFLTVAELAYLISRKKITSTRLTEIYLNRLKVHSDTLACTITLLEERAMSQARIADAEIANGQYRGPLHGIPYGIKDLFALEGFPTTWGAMPYKDQQLDETASIIHALDAAGAILVAKLTLGALAMGDIWYGGVTKNPWKLDQGSSGSSAGSASATSAGLVAFAIGTETWGSIVSPASRCGVTGLRPTYGRVSRTGAMALSWSMDKVGPICRSAQDCAMVFDILRGPDGIDNTLTERPFNYRETLDFNSLRVGYLKDLFERDYPTKAQDSASLITLENMGAKLIPLSLDSLKTPIQPLSIILFAESAAAFDGLTRSNQDSLLVAQRAYSWPNSFRSSRMIPAVEYIQAQRLRAQLKEEMEGFMDQVDVLVCPSFGGGQLLLSNLTGHPAVVVPNGFRSNQTKTSITFLGQWYQEAVILAFAKAFQEATDFHLQHPPLFQGP